MLCFFYIEFGGLEKRWWDNLQELRHLASSWIHRAWCTQAGRHVISHRCSLTLCIWIHPYIQMNAVNICTWAHQMQTCIWLNKLSRTPSAPSGAGSNLLVDFCQIVPSSSTLLLLSFTLEWHHFSLFSRVTDFSFIDSSAVSKMKVPPGNHSHPYPQTFVHPYSHSGIATAVTHTCAHSIHSSLTFTGKDTSHPRSLSLALPLSVHSHCVSLSCSLVSHSLSCSAALLCFWMHSKSECRTRQTAS